MRSLTVPVLIGAVFFLAARPLVALEIPLKQSYGEGGGVTIAYVDMETIFREFPETAKAKEEYYRMLNEQRTALADKEKQLADLREQLAVLKSTLEQAQTPAVTPVTSTDTAAAQVSTVTVSGLEISTAALSAMADSVAQRERLLQEQETALLQEQRRTAEELKQLEKRRALQIYGKLYKALTQLADEEGISLVVDKSSILYGQTAMDLTERLSRRVRGLPDVDTELQR